MTVLDPELFQPDPQPREVKYTVISVDDHVVEPPHLSRPIFRRSCGRRGRRSSRPQTARRCGSSKERSTPRSG